MIPGARFCSEPTMTNRRSVEADGIEAPRKKASSSKALLKKLHTRIKRKKGMGGGALKFVLRQNGYGSQGSSGGRKAAQAPGPRPRTGRPRAGTGKPPTRQPDRTGKPPEAPRQTSGVQSPETPPGEPDPSIPGPPLYHKRGKPQPCHHRPRSPE